MFHAHQFGDLSADTAFIILLHLLINRNCRNVFDAQLFWLVLFKVRYNFIKHKKTNYYLTTYVDNRDFVQYNKERTVVVSVNLTKS